MVRTYATEALTLRLGFVEQAVLCFSCVTQQFTTGPCLTSCEIVPSGMGYNMLQHGVSIHLLQNLLCQSTRKRLTEVKISGLDVYAVFEAWRVNIVTFRRIGGFAFPSMRALRFEEQRQREERQRVQQLQQRQQPPAEPGWLPLAILGGVVLVAMAALTGVVR